MTVHTLIADRRCKEGDICMADAMPFQQHYEVKVSWPIAECLHDKFFMNVSGRLKSGDRINIVRYSNDEWKEAIEVMEGVRVRYVDNQGVTLIYPANAKPELIDPAFDPGEKDIHVVRGHRGRFKVRLDGNTVKEWNTAVEADEYAEILSTETGRPAFFYTTEFKARYKQAA